MIAKTAALCARYASSQRAVAFRFEDRFFDDPGTLDKIAATFGGALGEQDREQIYAATRRESVERLIASLNARPTSESDYDEFTGQVDTWDRVTLWHKHHAGRRGEIGRWRHKLSASQAEAIEQRVTVRSLFSAAHAP